MAITGVSCEVVGTVRWPVSPDYCHSSADRLAGRAGPGAGPPLPGPARQPRRTRPRTTTRYSFIPPGPPAARSAISNRIKPRAGRGGPARYWPAALIEW